MIEWLKNHKLVAVLLLVILYLLYKTTTGLTLHDLQVSKDSGTFGLGLAPSRSFDSLGEISSPLSLKQESTTLGQRFVVQETNMSLVVEDVRGVGDKIVKYAEDQGGFMVQTTYSKPEEYPFGTVVIRVPKNKLNDSLQNFRSLSVKVSSENIMGVDVTEQYVDIKERLETLEKTKAKFEQILDNATQVQDILSVQRELIMLQEQIDALVGQQQSLEKNAELVKVTVYLSTDELALPYVPDQTFRPNVVFKQAVRGLVNTLRDLGTLGIWVGVYSVIWVPAVALIWFLKRRQKRNLQS